MKRRRAKALVRWLRRAAVLVAGGAILVIGIAMIVLPGPAIVAIPAGLGLLSLEFEWAAGLMKRFAEIRESAGARPTAEP